MKNNICYIEILSTDIKRTEQFFSSIFGWKFKKWDDKYGSFIPDQGIECGVSEVSKVEPCSNVIFYIEVDKIEPFLEKIENSGGKIKIQKTEIPDIGWFAHFNDPDSNTIGLFESKK